MFYFTWQRKRIKRVGSRSEEQAFGRRPVAGMDVELTENGAPQRLYRIPTLNTQHSTLNTQLLNRLAKGSPKLVLPLIAHLGRDFLDAQAGLQQQVRGK